MFTVLRLALVLAVVAVWIGLSLWGIDHAEKTKHWLWAMVVIAVNAILFTVWAGYAVVAVAQFIIHG
ncbi:MAG: hypothetical protein ABIY38_07890 [Rhodococcus sp. (in: high G+C Gram-positive bacteria)]